MFLPLNMIAAFCSSTSTTTFVPADLGASLAAYWDASRADLMTDDGGGLISSWRDSVGGYDAVATLAARPTYSATGFNGFPVVSGDGVANELTLAPVPAGIPIGATACEEWYLVDQQSLVADTTTRVIGGVGGATAGVSRRLARIVTSSVNRARLTDTGSTVSHTTVDFSGRHVVRLIATGTTVNVEVDGVAAAGAAQISGVTNPRVRFFADTAASAASFALCGIAARAITLPLTAGQASAMYAYFNRRL